MFMVGRRLYGDGICFATAFLESIPSKPLNDLHRTLTHGVYRSAVEVVQNKLGPKTTYLRQLRNSVATLRANISGNEHDIDNWEMALVTTNDPVHFPKIS